jgi:hypothetical protein
MAIGHSLLEIGHSASGTRKQPVTARLTAARKALTYPSSPDGGVAKWPKATVCKTVIRQFESARRLQQNLLYLLFFRGFSGLLEKPDIVWRCTEMSENAPK